MKLKQGFIKNCPSMKTNFSKLNENRLQMIIDNPKFNYLWNINKDLIKVCKDCEYRYCCTDCRAGVKSDFDKPIKCNYNPYQGLWSHEKGYINSEEWISIK